MKDIWMRIVENLSDRVSGPMKFSLVLQPVMAAIFAIRSGLTDAKPGKPPYFWALLTNPEHRIDMMKDGWKSVGKVFVLALVLDIRSSSSASCIRAKSSSSLSFWLEAWQGSGQGLSAREPEGKHHV